MAGVTANIDLQIRAKQTGTADLGTPSMLAQIDKSMEFSPGTAAVGQANILFSDERTIVASANEDLDLAGVLSDALGTVIAAAEVVAIYVEAAAGNTNDVRISQPASNGVAGIFLAAADGLSIGPGDCFLLTRRNGIGVVAATGDKINIANSGAGTSVTYKILIIGRTVAA